MHCHPLLCLWNFVGFLALSFSLGVPLFHLFVLFVAVTFGQMAFVGFYRVANIVWDGFIWRILLWTTKIVDILYSRWKCHLNNNSDNSSRKKNKTHPPNGINDATEAFWEMHTHIKLPTNFPRLDLSTHQHYCILYIANNQQTSRTLCGTKQTNKQTTPVLGALSEISPKKTVSHQTFVTLCRRYFAVCLAFIQKQHMSKPAFDYLQLCVYAQAIGQCVFRFVCGCIV